MPDYELSLSECCQKLTSSKVTQKKTGLTELEIFLANDECCKLLDDNHETGRGSVKWNSIYMAVHTGLLKEAERVDGVNPLVKTLGGFLTVVISKANSGEPKLICSDVISSVLEAFDNHSVRRSLPEPYLQVLIQILPENSYWSQIKLAKWEDLLKFCVTIFEECSNEMIKQKSLIVLSSVTEHGCKYSGFYHTARKLLNFALDVVQGSSNKNNRYLQDALRLSLTLCIQFLGRANLPTQKREAGNVNSFVAEKNYCLINSWCPTRGQLQYKNSNLLLATGNFSAAKLRKEYRLSVCRFGESLFPYLIDLPRETFTKWQVLPELLSEIIRIHHPCSVRDVASGAVAICTLEDWSAALKSLYSSIQIVIDDFQGEESVQKNKMIELAVITAKLSFKETETDSIDYSFFDEPACKKRRLIHHSISSIIEDIRAKKNSVSQWPWLAFMENVMINYPELLKDWDLKNLLEHVNEQLHSPPNHLVTKYLYRCATRLVIVESKRGLENKLNGVWVDVWSTVISKLQFPDSKIHLNELHNLLSALFMFKEINKDQVASFISLIIEGKLAFNIDTLSTLLVLTENGLLAESVETRLSLMNFLVRNRILEDPAVVNVFSRAVYSLILKSKCCESNDQTKLWPENETFLIESVLLTPPAVETMAEEKQDNVLECSIASRTLLHLLTELQDDFELNQDPITLIHHGTFLIHLSSLTGRNGISLFSDLQDLLRYILDRVSNTLRSHFNAEQLASLRQMIPSVSGFAVRLSQYQGQLNRLKLPAIVNGLFEFVKQSHTVKRAVSLSMDESFMTHARPKDPKSSPVIELEERQAIDTLVLLGESSKLVNFCTKPAVMESQKGFALIMAIIDSVTSLRTSSVNCETIENMANLVFDVSKIWLIHYEKSLDIIASVVKLLDTSSRLQIPNGRWSASLCQTASECFKVVHERKYGIKHHVAILGLFEKMIELDKNSEFIVSSINPVGLHPSLHLISFLSSQWNELRFTSSTILPIAFNSEDSELQSEIFNKASEAAENLFTISVEEDLTPEEIEEEGGKIACSSLAILVSLIASSALYRRRALFNFVKVVADKNIGSTLTKRALALIESKLKLTSVASFLEQNLDFVCLMWYKEHGDFKNFPFKIFGSPTLTMFLTEYKTCLVPIFLDNVDVKALEIMAETLETDQAALFKECFPEAMACYLRVVKGNRAKSDLMSKIIGRALGTDTMSKMLSDDLDKVLVCVFQKLHDVSNFTSLCETTCVVLPERSNMHATFSEIESALSYLQESKQDSNESFLSSLSVEGPYFLHLLIHALASNITEASTIEMKSLCLHHFVALCDCIASEIAQMSTMKGYFVRSAAHTLLRLSKTELAVPALKYLFRLLRQCMSECSEIINVLLEQIVPSLLNIVVCDGAAGINEALSLLDVLVVKNKACLPGVKELGPLPEHPRVIHLKSFEDREELELQDEIEKFLKISRASDDSFKGQALKHLLLQLHGKKSDLNVLYSRLKENPGLSEDCAVSPLHQLIVALVNLTLNSDPMIRETAVRCLGELGPRDLTTLVLKPQTAEKPIPLVDTIYELLIPLLVNGDVSVSEWAAEALKALLNTKEGVHAKGRLDVITQSFLSPFVALSTKPRRPYSVEMDGNSLISVLQRLTCPADKNVSHDLWIRSLVSAILNCFTGSNSFFRCLAPLAQAKQNIAESLIPYLAYTILAKDDNSSRFFEKKIEEFFENHFNEVGSESIYLNRASVSCILSIVHFYHQTNFVEKSEVKLKLNYLHVARAAQFCRAYFTSILYTELWADEVRLSLGIDDTAEVVSPLDAIGELSPDEGKLLRNNLWDGYKEIGETDAAYGFGAAYAVDPSERIKYLSQMESWPQVIEFCEIMGDPKYKPDLLHALRMTGMYKTACEASLHKTEYECAWRLSDWSYDIPEDEQNFSALHYSALKSLAIGDDMSANLFVDKARNEVIGSLNNVSLEVARSMYQPLSRLRILREIEKFKLDTFSEMIDHVTEEQGRWVDFEPILHQRSLLVDQSVAPQILFEATTKARKARSLLVARRFLEKIGEFDEISPETMLRVQLERAEILWESGDTNMARHLVKKLITSPKSSDSAVLSRALVTYGTWMSETKSESPSNIIHKYFEKANSICPKQMRSSVANSIAKLADSEYQRIQQYMKSSEYKAKVEILQGIEKQKKELDKLVSVDEDLPKMKGICNAQLEIHKKENERLQDERYFFLELAISQYIRGLLLSQDESNDLKIFRFASLWLDNRAHPRLNKRLRETLLHVPSSKFLRVLPQLAGHLSDDDSSFAQILRSVFQRCCEEHPHHALWLILAQINAQRDNIYLKTKNRNEEEPRVKAAKIIAKELEKTKTAQLVDKMQQLSEAYVSLAYYLYGKKVKPGPIEIPPKEALKRLKDIADIHCITAPLTVNKNYSHITGIVKFEDKFTFVGGLNAPKRIVCLCTDGVKRVQLIKGRDDSRQDAVLQQVFGIVNSLLENDENTAKRRLMLRTYKVVPLSRKSGVIEWVDNTEPLGAYLLSAHPKYRPQDMKPIRARELMGKVAKGSHEDRYEAFNTVCSNLKPVFRYFFTEKFSTPSVWFERRLAYTRSVASNSMTGYILGIGDRHVSNILIDLVTAEMIHIDFGICFEQGRSLPTPETVPFRLSRDVEDGMGISGVEGVFRRCCEETLRVLRKCHEPILTTLEVLLYDPLTIWAVSQKKAMSVQSDFQYSDLDMSSFQATGEDKMNTNTLGECALHRLKQKLEGRHEGPSLGVEAQVDLLINTARDPRNLCALFHGWQAYF